MGLTDQEFGFWCSVCGEYHEGMPLSFGFDLPFYAHAISPEERRLRCEYSDDFCVVDGKEFFIRGLLQIPILDGNEPFLWGIWASLSEHNFQRTLSLWSNKKRTKEPPYFGWFANSLPGYPETLNLKTHVHTQAVGERPLIKLEPTNHPLAVEQRNGITQARLHEVVGMLLHG